FNSDARAVNFFFQAEDGIRDRNVTEFRRVLFRSIPSTSAPIPNSSAACTNWACRASCGPSTRRLGWNAPSTPEPTGSSRTPRIVSSRSSRPSEPGPSELARLLARGPGDVAQVGLPGRGIGDGEATAGDLLGEDADEMVLRPRLQRGHVEGERLLQILGGVDLLRIALDDDTERGAVLGVDAVDLERHTGAGADGIDLRALTGADDESGVFDGVVDGEDLGPVV